jgi:ABC-type sugar transport system ATPase subunit
VYEGEIVCIRGVSGSGIHSLLEFLEGRMVLSGGSVYVEEHEVSLSPEKTLEKYGIYAISEKMNLAENLTVSENLELFGKKMPLWGYYNREKTVRKVQKFLESAGIHIPADVKVRDLSEEECQKLCIVKAGMYHARLVVLDWTKGSYEGKMADEIKSLVVKLRQKGVAFIIVSERENIFDEVADKHQIISHGRDLMEWRDREVDLSPQKTGEAPAEDMRLFEAFYDYQWKPTEGMWEYLQYVEKNNRIFWQEQVRLAHVQEGIYASGGVVYIPRESAYMLFDNLDICQNVIMAVRERLGKGWIGYISDEMTETIARGFYRLAGLDEHVTNTDKLTYVQRKILSVYRWEISKPKAIVMEVPFWGMDIDDTTAFCQYMRHLVEKEIRVIWLSQDYALVKQYCSRIIVTESGKNARIDT